MAQPVLLDLHWIAQQPSKCLCTILYKLKIFLKKADGREFKSRWARFLNIAFMILFVEGDLMAVEKDIQEIHSMMESLLTDSSIPKNVRKAISDAKTRLEGEDDIIVKISAAVYLIESIGDDINMPSHARTQVWALMSALESVKKR